MVGVSPNDSHTSIRKDQFGVDGVPSFGDGHHGRANRSADWRRKGARSIKPGLYPRFTSESISSGAVRTVVVGPRPGIDQSQQ